MRDMVVRDVVEEESPDPAKERTVNCGHDTAQERPLALAVVWDRWVRVVQERAHHDPVVAELMSRWSVKDGGHLVSLAYHVWDKVCEREV